VGADVSLLVGAPSAGIWLNEQYLDASPVAVLVVAPVLLLLNRDGGFFAGLTEERRYFPIIAGMPP